ncbi:exopolyphosphatase [Pseudaeromonas paramecii]|uniref:Exopolyphosphatase n=1 Tax=Pseudaeromonas paramecii TaxID=2138166 RepID=A0ABP8Q0F8_9GAMM
MSSEWLAAIDMGSNSFHLVIARQVDGRLQIVDRLKERVQLAEGLEQTGRLSPEAMARGLACLRLFGERLGDIPRANLRITGTFTLRVASNADLFLTEARALLGHPVEVISGLEEARLIYQGVAHTQHTEGRLLVIDIGGGSTELIIGEEFAPLALTSRKMGCVTFSNHFFGNGRLTDEQFDAAILEAQHQLEPIMTRYRELGWEQCLGSSGTIKAVHELLLAAGRGPQIDQEGLRLLRSQMVAQKRVEQLKLPGLSEDRRPVIAAGVAILLALFDALHIQQMDFSDGALREGSLYSLTERQQHSDIRERTASGLAQMYHIDPAQAARVEATVLGLFDQVADAWGLEVESYRPLLAWAAQLHEVGLVINYSAVQKHSAYLLANSDLPGFNQQEQAFLALMARFQRKAIKRGDFTPIQNHEDEALWRCIRLLRLAVALHHRRQDGVLPPLHLKAKEHKLTLSLPAAWCRDNALLMQNLTREQKYAQELGWELKLRQETESGA